MEFAVGEAHIVKLHFGNLIDCAVHIRVLQSKRKVLTRTIRKTERKTREAANSAECLRRRTAGGQFAHLDLVVDVAVRVRLRRQGYAVFFGNRNGKGKTLEITAGELCCTRLILEAHRGEFKTGREPWK